MNDLFIGFTSLAGTDGILRILMMLIGILLIWLAIKKEYEPMLLLPIGFGAILVNLPLSVAFEYEGAPGFLKILFEAGIATELFPVLIFIAVEAMCDFGPMFQNPVMMFFGAAAQFGIFFTVLAALALGRAFPQLGFDLPTASAIGIIGAADGPTSIYVASKFARPYLGPISVAAYSYMSLVPLIQPPVIKALTSKKERVIKMKINTASYPRGLRIVFPIAVTVIAGLVAPMSVPLIGSLMFGNLIRECGVLEKLSLAAQNELASIVTLLLGITIGSSMRADQFLRPQTLIILALGLVAFIFDTAGGVLFAKFLNLFRKEGDKINPMVGAAGISAFPMSARVIQKLATAEDGNTFVIMEAVSANVSGQLGSVMAGGIVLALVPVLMGW
ncbi:MAG: sodium ion-translocating decarboxylase subunit beta [Spirochaetaceae bacterium]|jgi:oxaloacetate decarboxylase beta subunit|nr:sodium ion-translocating decarboxylase subunit beta [Spirochaetaceae bacterium]